MQNSLKWLILAGIFVAGAAASALETPSPGPCARINYESCCPPGDECQTVDDNGVECGCGSDCHVFGDCCEDADCPENPETCADIGITTCCNDTSNTGLCEVHSYNDYYCSCNLSCHLRNDCCPDAREIGCVPLTCSEAGLSPGCCQWHSNFAPASCTVQLGQGRVCFCDWLCTLFNDCCDDVSNLTASSCLTPAQWSRDKARVQTRFKQASKAAKTSTRRVSNAEKGHRTRIQGVTFESHTPGYNFREALADRIHRTRRPHTMARGRPRPRLQATRRYHARG